MKRKLNQRTYVETEFLRRSPAKIIKPTALDSWLEKPNSAFGGRTPLQVIDDGESDRLWEMIYLLQSGELY